MLDESLASVQATFAANVASVTSLMRFDADVLEFAILHLQTLQSRLRNDHGLDNPRFDVEKTLAMLRNIRHNDSLQPHYRQMLNQCVVLLVSYFSSAVGDIFKMGVVNSVRHGQGEKLMKEEVKISLRDLPEIGRELVERSGELLVSHRQISFQNLEMVAVSFRDYFNYHRPSDETTNDLILAHACRHSIVHNGACVDRKMIGQLRAASPRTLKLEIGLNQSIQFAEEEILIVADRMTSYLADLAGAVAS